MQAEPLYLFRDTGAALLAPFLPFLLHSLALPPPSAFEQESSVSSFWPC